MISQTRRHAGSDMRPPLIGLIGNARDKRHANRKRL